MEHLNGKIYMVWFFTVIIRYEWVVTMPNWNEPMLSLQTADGATVLL